MMTVIHVVVVAGRMRARKGEQFTPELLWLCVVAELDEVGLRWRKLLADAPFAICRTLRAPARLGQMTGDLRRD